jgi:hypothetical protein
MEPCACRDLEEQLEAEGLGSLDYHHERLPFVLTGNRGSGKLLTEERAQRRDAAAADMNRRREIWELHTFRLRFHRTVWERYVEGTSIKQISRDLGESFNRCWRAVRDTRLEYAKAGASGAALIALAKRCDRETLILVCALIRRALEKPEGVEQALETVEAFAGLAKQPEVTHGDE